MKPPSAHRRGNHSRCPCQTRTNMACHNQKLRQRMLLPPCGPVDESCPSRPMDKLQIDELLSIGGNSWDLPTTTGLGGAITISTLDTSRPFTKRVTRSGSLLGSLMAAPRRASSQDSAAPPTEPPSFGTRNTAASRVPPSKPPPPLPAPETAAAGAGPGSTPRPPTARCSNLRTFAGCLSFQRPSSPGW